MSATPHSLSIFHLAGMLLGCCAVPPLLGFFFGPIAGVVGSVGAASIWYWQYRFPNRRERSGYSFWFVAAGYGIIAVTLLVSLGRLM